MAEKEFKVGVIVGKFMPFHNGHDYLVRHAKERCEVLYVVIAHKDGQMLSLETRHKWISELHPDVKIRNINATTIPDWDSVLWAKITIEAIDGKKPDAAFSSEEYAKAWCKEMGCENIIVDLDRKKYQVSGTEIRKDPYAYLDLLPINVSTDILLEFAGRSFGDGYDF